MQKKQEDQKTDPECGNPSEYTDQPGFWGNCCDPRAHRLGKPITTQEPQIHTSRWEEASEEGAQGRSKVIREVSLTQMRAQDLRQAQKVSSFRCLDRSWEVQSTPTPGAELPPRAGASARKNQNQDTPGTSTEYNVCIHLVFWFLYAMKVWYLRGLAGRKGCLLLTRAG